MSSASSSICWNGKQQSFGQSVRSAQYYAMPPSGTPPNTIWINLIPMHSFLNTSSSYLQLIGFPIYFLKLALPNNHRGTIIIFKTNLKQVSTNDISVPVKCALSIQKTFLLALRLSHKKFCCHNS